MSELRDQYCVRLGPKPDAKRQGYVLWRLSRRELGSLLRRWKPDTWRKVSTGRKPVKGKFHPTARRRAKPPNPLRAAMRDFGACQRALYHGVGRDTVGVRMLEKRCKAVVAYDPFHPDARATSAPRGRFDEVVSLYTLNVVSPAEGVRALRQIHRALRPKGHVTIAVRSDVCAR